MIWACDEGKVESTLTFHTKTQALNRALYELWFCRPKLSMYMFTILFLSKIKIVPLETEGA